MIGFGKHILPNQPQRSLRLVTSTRFSVSSFDNRRHTHSAVTPWGASQVLISSPRDTTTTACSSLSASQSTLKSSATCAPVQPDDDATKTSSDARDPLCHGVAARTTAHQPSRVSGPKVSDTTASASVTSPFGHADAAPVTVYASARCVDPAASPRVRRLMFARLDNTTVAIDVPSDFTVLDIKRRLSSQHLAPCADHVWLAIGGVRLDDARVLASYSIYDDQRVQVRFRVRGGGQSATTLVTTTAPATSASATAASSARAPAAPAARGPARATTRSYAAAATSAAVRVELSLDRAMPRSPASIVLGERYAAHINGVGPRCVEAIDKAIASTLAASATVQIVRRGQASATLLFTSRAHAMSFADSFSSFDARTQQRLQLFAEYGATQGCAAFVGGVKHYYDATSIKCITESLMRAVPYARVCDVTIDFSARHDDERTVQGNRIRVFATGAAALEYAIVDDGFGGLLCLGISTLRGDRKSLLHEVLKSKRVRVDTSPAVRALLSMALPELDVATLLPTPTTPAVMPTPTTTMTPVPASVSAVPSMPTPPTSIPTPAAASTVAAARVPLLPTPDTAALSSSTLTTLTSPRASAVKPTMTSPRPSRAKQTTPSAASTTTTAAAAAPKPARAPKLTSPRAASTLTQTTLVLAKDATSATTTTATLSTSTATSTTTTTTAAPKRKSRRRGKPRNVPPRQQQSAEPPGTASPPLPSSDDDAVSSSSSSSSSTNGDVGDVDEHTDATTPRVTSTTGVTTQALRDALASIVDNTATPHQHISASNDTGDATNAATTNTASAVLSTTTAPATVQALCTAHAECQQCINNSSAIVGTRRCC